MPLNVLFFESGISGGGSFESLHQLLRKIDRSRIRPVVGFLNKTRYFDIVRNLDVPTYLLTDLVYTQKIPKILRGNLERRVDRVFLNRPQLADFVVSLGHGWLISQLCSIARKEKIDILYCNDNINRDIFGCYVAKKMNIPFVSHLRSTDGKTFAGAKVDFANRWVDSYIANSDQCATYWIGRGAASRKMHVVYNAVEQVDSPSVDIRKELHIPANTKIIVSMGRLVPLKGHPFLLNSFADLLKNGVNAHLVIAGDGPDRTKLEALAKSLGLEGRVSFIGHDSRGSALIAGADLLALTSNKESFGRVLIEAMQVGVPVVGTNIGGIPDVIQHEKNGLLVEYDDRTGLSNAFKRLLEDQELRLRCIENGQLVVADKFDLNVHVNEIERIIEAVSAKANRMTEQR
ncbi:glycosyltransferase family 4 protein [Pseudodesulfovibrio thermohalotolerans]|uniref:glycosyltransferase family 4 protein n=1 Tax=Pseudodesulfovibrio thermohalotolerans TaxID=2880651 RepID=UPI0024413FBE|nr:glycosyltransferase family 4 protein [Pseudodesulfovibrio thermohalotolerans]WFS61213.1 glycosyltransferase family 4 protein [Pseudodesulfovibrio thermohalotolerans]